MSLRNPIVRGMAPDPSIVRVGDAYYLATSTFEWFPGVRIHRSTDLENWTVVGHVLDGENRDLVGVPDSGGIWAPSLTHVDGEFWLLYSIVHTMDGDDLDVRNYLVRSRSASGPWSDPVDLGSRGFDFSFFHEEARHWIVGVQWDHRPGQPRFSGIVLQEFDAHRSTLVGPAHPLLPATDKLVEGPNIYRQGDWYYLTLAEGGTGWNHGVAVARSRALLGPYERDPQGPLLTTRDAPGHPLQKAGHGELVATPGGEWMLVHLAARPVLHAGRRYCTLGRETSIQRVRFDDGWIRLAQGGWHPRIHPFEQSDDRVPPVGVSETGFRDDFDALVLDTSAWSTLRRALSPSEADLTSRPGWLRLRGGASAGSVFGQSMIARAAVEHRSTIEALVEADPPTSRQSAGLVAWYDRSGYCTFIITHDAEHGRHARVVERDGVTTSSPPVPLEPGPVRLRMSLHGDGLIFHLYCADGTWRQIEHIARAWTLSDDHGDRLRFTGLHLGIRADDLDGIGWYADFDAVSITAHMESGVNR